ncbi:MAG: WD40 repeat domain-containing protein, partial [Burkholderiales bacterium]
MKKQMNRTAPVLGVVIAFVFSILPARAQFKAAAETGQVLQPRASIAPDASTWGIAFTHDGKAVWLTDGSKATLWDLETGEAKITLEYHSSEHPDWHMLPIESLAMSPDGKTMASGGQDSVVKIWDPETGQVKSTSELKGGEVKSV